MRVIKVSTTQGVTGLQNQCIGINVSTQQVAGIISIIFIVVNIYFSVLERLSLHGHTHTKSPSSISNSLQTEVCHVAKS